MQVRINYKLLLIGLSFLAGACVQSKKITKGNVFYKFGMENGSSFLHRYEVEKPFQGSISDKGGYVTIKPDDQSVISDDGSTNYTTHEVIPIPGSVTGTNAQIQADQVYFFKETDFDTTPTKRDVLTFLDSELMLQTLAVPLKIRPALTGPEFGNAFPQQVETGFNFGFAVGWKFNRNAYRFGPNILGLNNNQVSLSPGLLLNFGSTPLNEKNTLPAFAVERKAFTYSGGFALLLGFNRINFGVARGVDYVTGNGKGDWVYQGEPWTGIIVALDLLK